MSQSLKAAYSMHVLRAYLEGFRPLTRRMFAVIALGE